MRRLKQADSQIRRGTYPVLAISHSTHVSPRAYLHTGTRSHAIARLPSYPFAPSTCPSISNPQLRSHQPFALCISQLPNTTSSHCTAPKATEPRITDQYNRSSTGSEAPTSTALRSALRDHAPTGLRTASGIEQQPRQLLCLRLLFNAVQRDVAAMQVSSTSLLSATALFLPAANMALIN
ncbi:hypothetical protein BDZ45DRAFT_743807 [Acephala macrosclerotiorum]|nr:hypothetical protein BDZ45DRAFT_743807 [Acephala macrosclerotiorum]